MEEPHVGRLIPATQSIKEVIHTKRLSPKSKLSSSHIDQKNGQRDRKIGRYRKNRRKIAYLANNDKAHTHRKDPPFCNSKNRQAQDSAPQPQPSFCSLLRFTTPKSKNPSQLTTAVTKNKNQTIRDTYRSGHRAFTSNIVIDRQALSREGSRHCKERRVVLQVRYFQLVLP